MHVCVSVFVYEDWATSTVRLFSENQARELFLPPPPLPVSSARGARGCRCPRCRPPGGHVVSHRPPWCTARPLPGAPCERQLRAAPPPPRGIIHLRTGWLCFFFSNSCPLLPSCVFTGTSYTTGGHPYLITNFNVNAFTDSPLV